MPNNNNSSNNNTTVATTIILLVLQEFDAYRVYLVFPLVAIGVFGVVTNGINIAIFARMTSTKDTTSISLFAMSLSDFLVCLTGVGMAFCEWPLGQQLIFHNLNWSPFDFQFFILSQPHVLIARTTLSITAFITVERCLCVAIPLKVKTILTRTVVKSIIAGCYLLPWVCYTPVFIAERSTKCFLPVLNKYINCIRVNYVLYEFLKEWLMPLSVWLFYGFQFSIIFICTLILAIVLIKKSRWRLDASVSTSANKSSVKEKKVVRMMVLLASSFIVCNTPSTISWIWHEVDKEFNVQGDMKNVLAVLSFVSYFLESVGAAINLFIYYSNSSKYKETFDQKIRIFNRRKTG